MTDFKPCCEICGLPNADKHHIITRGAGGQDVPDNWIYLCRAHHSSVHATGRETFFRRWLLEKRLEVAKAAYRIYNGGKA